MSGAVWDAYNRRWLVTTTADAPEIERLRSELKSLRCANKTLLERLIQAQNDAAKWRERAIEAESKCATF